MVRVAFHLNINNIARIVNVFVGELQIVLVL